MIYKMKGFSKIFKYFFIGFLLLISGKIRGQHVLYYPNHSFIKPLVVIQCEESCFEQMKDSVENNIHKTVPSYLLLNISKLTNAQIRDTVNYYLNTQDLDAYKVYLVIAGGNGMLKRQEGFYDRIYAARYFITHPNTDNYVRGYHVIFWNELNFYNMISQFLRNQLWEIDLKEIKNLTEKETIFKKTPVELGFGFTGIFPSGIHTLYDIPTHISVFLIKINKPLSPKYKLMTDIGIGMNMPSKNNATMETSFVGQDYKLMGSSMLTWSVHVARYLSQKDGFYPFVALGITKSNLMLMYQNLNSSAMSIKPEMYSYGSLTLTTGAEFKFSNRVSMEIKTSYNFSLNTGARIDNFNASGGININLQKKTKYYYQYLRLK